MQPERVAPARPDRGETVGPRVGRWLGDGMSAPDLGPNLVALFERMASKQRERPFLWVKRDGVYQPWSRQRVAQEVRFLARG